MSDYKIFSLGQCNFHLAKRIMSELPDEGQAPRPDTESGDPPAEGMASGAEDQEAEGQDEGMEAGAEDEGRPPRQELDSDDDTGSSDDETRRPNSQNFRRGAPFIHYPNYTYVGRDNSGCEFPRERGPRMYRVDVDGEARIYIVERTVEGSNRFERVDLLGCQHEGCTIFGYKYRGVIYHYGYHNHGYECSD